LKKATPLQRVSKKYNYETFFSKAAAWLRLSHLPKKYHLFHNNDLIQLAFFSHLPNAQKFNLFKPKHYIKLTSSQSILAFFAPISNRANTSKRRGKKS
jgi:hypothetical protein